MSNLKFGKKINSNNIHSEDLVVLQTLNNKDLTVSVYKIDDYGRISSLGLKTTGLLRPDFHFPALSRLSIWQAKKIIDYKFLSKHKDLTELHISHSDLTNIPDLSQHVNLEELSLKFNNISKIEGLDSLTSLKKLNLSGNQITKIDGLNSLTNLEELNLWKNQIATLDEKGLENLQNLRSLNLREDLIQELDFDGADLSLNKLDEINLAENKIGQIICFKGLPALKYLDLSDNRLTSLEKLSGLPLLKIIDITGNPIESFSGIEALPTPIDIGSLYKDELSKETLRRILGYFRKHGIKHVWTQPNYDTDEFLTEEEKRICLYFYKTQPPDAFYKINEYLSLELERDKVHLYVDGEDFRQCIALFIPNPQAKPTQELINSIDEAEEMLIDPSERDSSVSTLGITPEQEFWAHCSVRHEAVWLNAET